MSKIDNPRNNDYADNAPVDEENSPVKTNPAIEKITAIKKRDLFERLVNLYEIPAEKAQHKIDYLMTNLDTLTNAAHEMGMYYGIAPHRIPVSLKTRIIELGANFLEGSRYSTSKTLEAGLDIFKVLLVELDSEDYQKWKNY